MYKGQVPIPPLAMVDDVVATNECNTTDALTCNIKTDTFIQRKKLESQVGEGKCQWVHSGEGECRGSYHANNTNITQTESYKYLGDHVSDGWEPLYNKRWDKATSYPPGPISPSTSREVDIDPGWGGRHPFSDW